MNKDLKDIIMVFCGSPGVPCLDERIFEELEANLDYAIQFYKNPGRFLDGIPPAVHWMVNPLPFYLPVREPYVRRMGGVDSIVEYIEGFVGVDRFF